MTISCCLYSKKLLSCKFQEKTFFKNADVTKDA